MEAGRLEAFFLENLKRQDGAPELNRKPGIFRSGRHKRLTKSQKTAFQELYDIRDRYARDLDLPPNTVLSNNDLFALVQGEMTPGDLGGNRRVPASRLEALTREVREYMDGR
jgi:ribonuclease D